MKCPRRNRAQSQRGNMAIEFAIVFPLFFVVFYAIVTFSLIFVAQQSLTLAAEEGARAALRYQTGAKTVDDSLARRGAAACRTATALTNWLASAATCTTQPSACKYDTTLRCLQVTLDYDYAGTPLVPPLPLLKLALPDALIARASVQLDPDNML